MLLTANHNWIKSTLGHGETMCSYCMVTNREAAVLGITNTCDSVRNPANKKQVEEQDNNGLHQGS